MLVLTGPLIEGSLHFVFSDIVVQGFLLACRHLHDQLHFLLQFLRNVSVVGVTVRCNRKN